MARILPECNSLVGIEHDAAILDAANHRTAFSFSREKLAIERSTNEMPNKTDVLIIGGGLIGCALAAQLRKALPTLKLIIVDPKPGLLSNYIERTAAVGQHVMRSPYDHQLAPDGDIQLIDFARLNYDQLLPIEKKQVRNAVGGQRGIVPLDLFLSHSANVVNNYGLRYLSYRGQVSAIKKNKSLLNVHFHDGNTLLASNVIATTGLSERDNLVGYRYDEKVASCYGDWKVKKGESIAVIGSGLSAGHVLSGLIKQGHRPTWVIRCEEETYRCTDVTSMYFREEGVCLFKEYDLKKRQQILAVENRGSLMLEYLDLFQSFEKEGLLKVIRNFTVRALVRKNDQIELKGDREVLVDRVIDCCGLIPQYDFIPKEYTHDNGYPVFEAGTLQLKDHPNLFFAGASASMLLGPGSKNVEGARLAAEEILRKFKAKVKRYDFINFINGNSKID